MSKRRGKNRPPKLTPAPPKGAPPVVFTTCRSCPDLAPKDSLEGGQCQTCLAIEREARTDYTIPRSQIAMKQFDTGAAARGRRYRRDQ